MGVVVSTQISRKCMDCMLEVQKVKAYTVHVKAGKQLSYPVDGYFVDSKGVEHILEFNSCWYHRCPRCYPGDRDTLTINTKSLKLRYLETLKTEKTLTSMGYIIHSMWSCDFV